MCTYVYRLILISTATTEGGKEENNEGSAGNVSKLDDHGSQLIQPTGGPQTCTSQAPQQPSSMSSMVEIQNSPSPNREQGNFDSMKQESAGERRKLLQPHKRYSKQEEEKVTLMPGRTRSRSKKKEEEESLNAKRQESEVDKKL